jgi:hypothetical protein
VTLAVGWITRLGGLLGRRAGREQAGGPAAP